MNSKFTVYIDGQPVTAVKDKTVAAILVSLGYHTFFHNEPPYSDNRYFCGMGVCMQCLVTVNKTQVRACRTAVQPDMQIETSG